MRGKLGNQDLTNYALNDGLDDRERLYVESMLGVSEECRHDVYAMIEIAQMIETGFERENGRANAELTAEQREQLMHPPRRPALLVFAQQAAAAVAMAACVALILSHSQFWPGRASAARFVHNNTSKVNQIIANAAAHTSGPGSDDFGQFVELHEILNDSQDWLEKASDSLPKSDTICTPPSWPDRTDFTKSR